jgi:predicted nucleic acid-binding Zn finger protein
MQELTIEQKKVKSSKQKVVSSEELENSSEVKGYLLSQTRNVFYMSGAKDLYYVQSEHSDSIYYFVKYNPDIIEYCTCPDNLIRLEKCKHIFAIEKSIVKGILKEIDKIPTQAKTFANQNKIPIIKQSTSLKDSEYSF